MRELVEALEAWRAAKSPALADEIDRLSAQVPREPPPRRDQHEHWMRAALAYDPVGAAALIDSAHERAHKGDAAWGAVVERLGDDPIVRRILARCQFASELPIDQRNRIERLCAFARWPDDPRVATILARWFARDGFIWSYPYSNGVLELLDVLAEQLIRIGDARVVPLVASCIDRPRARTEQLRQHQRGVARRIVDALGAFVAAPSRVLDERPLWEAVARDPDDIETRLVLADFLQQHGDRRGELIALACSSDRKLRARADQLLAENLSDWLGDLALIVKRDAKFDRGTLDSVTLGVADAPAWAYGELGDHRELITVRRVARSFRNPIARQYATFVNTLPELSRVALAADPDTLDELARLRPQWPTRSLELEISHQRPDRIAHAIDRVCTLFPALASIDIRSMSAPGAYVGMVPRLAAIPRIVVHGRYWFGDISKAELDALAASMPNVEVRHG